MRASRERSKEKSASSYTVELKCYGPWMVMKTVSMSQSDRWWFAGPEAFTLGAVLKDAGCSEEAWGQGKALTSLSRTETSDVIGVGLWPGSALRWDRSALGRLYPGRLTLVFGDCDASCEGRWRCKPDGACRLASHYAAVIVLEVQRRWTWFVMKR